MPALSNNTALPNSRDIIEDEDMAMSSEDAANASAPPPRIAARFYRPSSSRRRSSAASSRRNSITSAQSHQSHHSHQSRHSHHSYHGSQSNHVAQHLRRASIIETRKARLADRAAHAEKVRLRAALAKAAPRPSNSGERAFAAHQARERLLAQVAAACAEEVKRAKRVAEDTKEKREAEHRRQREEMEEKMAEAERRRVQYKLNAKRGRTSSLPRIEEKRALPPVDPAVIQEEAARRIQRLWRRTRPRRIIEDYLRLGLSLKDIRNSTFEQVSSVLAEQETIDIAAKVLRLCGLQDASQPDDTVTVRTFLSAYMVLGFPGHVFSNNGEQEEDLVSKSRQFIESFEQALAQLGNGRTILSDLAQAPAEEFQAFRTAFAAWKAHDSSALLKTMIAEYVELDSVWQTIKDKTVEVVQAEYREGIRNTQILVLVRIKRLVGQEKAMKMIRNAVRAARRERSRSRPRTTIEDSRPVVPLASASNPSSDPAIIDSQLSALPQLPKPVSQDQASQYAAEISSLMSTVPENRVLVHELALDKEFSLDQTVLLDPSNSARQAIHRAIFDTMRQDLSTGQGDRWIVAMAVNIRHRLLRLLTPGNSMHVLISETLDPALVERELVTGQFSYERFFSFMANVLPKLCAPFRDAEVSAALSPSLSASSTTANSTDTDELIARLTSLLHIIDVLSLDYANYLLRAAASTLIQEAPGYENRRFEADLTSNTITLQQTRSWWLTARNNLMTEAIRRDPEQIQSLASRRPMPERIYLNALVDLAVNLNSNSRDVIPETLSLDRSRLIRIRSNALHLTLVASIVLTAKNLLRRDVRVAWKAEASHMWDALTSATDESSIEPENLLASVLSSHALPATSRAHLNAFTGKLLAQARTGAGFTDPVPKLLLRRVRMYLLSKLSATQNTSLAHSSSSIPTTMATGSSSASTPRAQGATNPRAPGMATSTEEIRSLSSAGLIEFVPRLAALADELRRIADVDRASHERWYEEIETSIRKEESSA